MADYPDINNADELAAAIAALEVLGGLSRSYTLDPATGDYEPDRYVETLGDYLSVHAIKTLLENAFKHSHIVDGVDGVITAASRDSITLSYADGSEAHFFRQTTGLQKEGGK